MEPTQDLNVFFDGAKTSLAEIGRLNSEVTQLRNQQTKLEDSLRSQEEKLEKELNSKYNKALSGIDKTYDGQIDKEKDELQRAMKKREKAKNQGVKERIAEETAPLRSEIRDIESGIRSSLRSKGLPGYCNSDLFYSLFLPKTLGDFLLLLIVFAVAFFLIPVGIWKLFFVDGTVALIIIYVVDILIFVGIYTAISRKTVMKHHDLLEDIRIQRLTIANDKRKINTITHNIEHDTNETYYDLAVYDDEIAHIRQQLADLTMQKKDAVNKFETVTKNIITEETTAAVKPEMDKTGTELEATQSRLRELEETRKAKMQEINTNYEVYLGKDFMTRSKIDALEEIINHGTATTLEEAKEEYYRRTDI